MKTNNVEAGHVRFAWEVDVDYTRCIVFAATAAKARWIAVKSYWEAGCGRKGEWPRPEARREPQFDNCRLSAELPRAFSREYVETVSYDDHPKFAMHTTATQLSNGAIAL